MIAFLYVLLFLYASGSKLLEYSRFAEQLEMSSLVTRFAGWVSWAIPTVEILISVMLITPHYRVLGFCLAYGLMMVFTLMSNLDSVKLLMKDEKLISPDDVSIRIDTPFFC